MSSSSSSRTGGIGERLARVEPRHYKLVFYLFLLAWLVYLVVVSIPWNWRDKLVALIVGVPAIVLLLLKIVMVLWPARFDRLRPSQDVEVESDDEVQAGLQQSLREAREGSAVVRPRPEQLEYAVRMIVWVLALPIGMFVIGFANTLPLYIAAFGYRFYQRKHMAIPIAVVFSALMYLFFFIVVGMQSHEGLLGIPSILRVLDIYQ